MNFSGISNRSLLGKLLRVPLQVIPASLRIPILQGRLRGKQWIVGSSQHGCWLGSYEYDKQCLLEQTIGKGSTVFDLGACAMQVKSNLAAASETGFLALDST